MKAKKLFKTLGICGLVAVMAFSFATLFLTDSDNATNEFTVGDIKIDLSEPTWDENHDPENPPPPTVPNEVVEKDPTVENVGVNDAYMFVAVYIPTAEVTLVDDDGTPAEEATVEELFAIQEQNENWILVGKDSSFKDGDENEPGYVVYLFAYADDDGMVAVAPNESTEEVFAKVKMVNFMEDEDICGTDTEIDVVAYAIQADWIGDDDSPEAVWSIISNQRDIDFTADAEEEDPNSGNNNDNNDDDNDWDDWEEEDGEEIETPVIPIDN